MGRKGERELARVQDEVRETIAAGRTRFVVSIYAMIDGTTHMSINRMREVGQPMLLDMGLNVVGMNYESWEHTTHYEVEVPEIREPEKTCPFCAETIKEAAIICRFCKSELA